MSQRGERKRAGILTLGGSLFSVCRSKSPRGCIERLEKCHRNEAGAQPGVEQHDHTSGQHRCRGEGDGDEGVPPSVQFCGLVRACRPESFPQATQGTLASVSPTV